MFELRPIGHVESTLTDREHAPKQGFEGAPQAWLVLDPGMVVGISHVEATPTCWS